MTGSVSRFLGAHEPPRTPPSQSAQPPESAQPAVEPRSGGLDYSFVPPELSGIPPGPNDDDVFAGLQDDLGVSDDAFASNLLWKGWFADDVSSAQRREAREMFFDHTGLGEWEFDWDSWRDWYETTSG